jgi:hypothetical protein
MYDFFFSGDVGQATNIGDQRFSTFFCQLLRGFMVIRSCFLLQMYDFFFSGDVRQATNIGH